MAKSHFYHPDLTKLVAVIVQQCKICQQYKGCTVQPYPVERRIAERPYQYYAMDLMDLPKTRAGFVTLLVGIDRYSRFGHVIPLRNKTSRLVAGALEANILSSVPITPEVIFTDDGAEFKGKEFNQVLVKYGIRHNFALPFRPHSYGGVERFNQTLKQRLMLVSAERKIEWDKVLHEVVAQYNRTPHDDTGKAPVEFFHTEHPQLNSPREKTYWRIGGSNFQPFQTLDLVMRKIPFYKPGQNPKLAPSFEGPYIVKKFLESEVVYTIKRVSDGLVIPRIHISQLKKYYVSIDSADNIEVPAKKPLDKTPVRRPRSRGMTQKHVTPGGDNVMASSTSESEGPTWVFQPTPVGHQSSSSDGPKLEPPPSPTEPEVAPH